MLACIVLGLASRRYPQVVPSFVGKYPGDALWAAMVFFGWAALLLRATRRHVALLACATSAAIELLKLWSSPWWSGIRQSTAGHLVFGHVFSWQNLVAYAVGIAVAFACEPLLARRGRADDPGPPRRD